MKNIYPVFFTKTETVIGTLNVNDGTFAGEGMTVVSLVDIDSGAYRRKIDTKSVRKNVTIPS